MIAELFTGSITQFISSIGYPGVLILTALMPAPLEVTMLFSGYLAYNGTFDLILVSLVGAAGCTISSVLSYIIGLKGGRPFLEKYGKYLFLEKNYLELTEKWFAKYGDKAVFFLRLVPGVHTLVSFPAGIGKYDFKKLVLLSFLGYLPCCFALAYTGFLLGPYWENILSFLNGMDIAMIAIAILVAIYFLKIKKLKRQGPS
ncbi:MAG: DedA family protein [Candidatus Methanoperedens sp.]|nr:DedA family protein [Candidatus Methanoperedens sp.]